MKNKILKSQKELRTIKIEKNRIYVKARFGPSKITKIPFHINEELAFFIATIIGDGHLKKSKKQITIELTDKYILEEIKRICLQTFEREFNICDIKKRKDRKQSYNINMDSKAIHNLLNQVYGIQIGKKSHIVQIPDIIKKSNKSIKSAFLIGIMVTEGGKRRRQYGLSTASENLWNDLINLFSEINISTSKDKWIYKKYEKEYYGLIFRKDKLPILIKKCKNDIISKVLSKHFNLTEKT